MTTAASRLLSWMALSLGGIGVVACCAGMVGVWMVRSQLGQTTESVFAQIDRSLVAVRDRVVATEQRVEASRITTEDIGQRLKDWAEQEASERLTTQLDIEEKSQYLASGLQQADHWLEFSQSSIQLIQRALELGYSAGVPVKVEPIDHLLEDLTSLRTQLMQATDSVERIRKQTSEAGEERSLDQAVRLGLRAVATLSSIDSHLRDLEGGLSETRTTLQSTKAKTFRWMRFAAIGITFLIFWMAVGQFSLCLRGWQKLHVSGR